MRKVIAKDTWYYQGNNAQVDITRDYTLSILKKKLSEVEYKRIASFLPKYTVCGPESLACGIDIQKWDMSIFTPGEQPGDSIFNIFNNPLHEKTFRKYRDLPTEKWSYNEIPQYYPVIMNFLYGGELKKYGNGVIEYFHKGKLACRFAWKINYNQIIEKLDNNVVMIVAGPGHFYLLNGYDTNKKILIKKDPMHGNNINCKYKSFGFRIEIYPYEKK